MFYSFQNARNCTSDIQNVYALQKLDSLWRNKIHYIKLFLSGLEMIHTHFGPASVDNYQPQTLYQQQQKRKQQEQQHQPSQQQQQKQQDQLHPQQEEQQQQEQQQQQEEEHHHSQQQQQQQKQQEEEQQQNQQQQQHISTIICNPPPSIISTSNGTTMCVTKLMIGLDHAPPAFNVRSRVLGDGGTNLNYIRTETGAIVTLRGRGSLNLEPQTMQEAPEPLHLFIEHPL